MAAEQKTETEKRIQQMVAFIKQEARDKAEEIEVRAKEDVNVEVLKMQDRDKAKWREFYKQQEKRVEIEAKIAKQQLLDSFRMKHLQIQDEKVTQGAQLFSFGPAQGFLMWQKVLVKKKRLNAVLTKSFVCSFVSFKGFP